MNPGSILVVGGTGGLGPVVVRRLAEGGFTVVFTGRRPDGVRAVEAIAPEARGFAIDATDGAAMKDLIASIESGDGLAGYVHLAGGWVGGRWIDEIDPGSGEWESMFRSNWESLRVAGTLAFGAMRRRGGGAIVTIGSIAGLEGTARAAAYAVAKAAVINFTRCLAEEGKKHGVRANCIVPGIIDTEANRAAMPQGRREDWVSPSRIAETILHLCSPASSGVNGSTVLMTGGL